jgi:hypothetical protein
MVIAIVLIATAMAILVMRVEGLALFAPGRTTRIKGSAQAYCLDHCRNPDGSCPLGLRAKDCPLWQFVEADLPTDLRTDPFRPIGWVELEGAGAGVRE